MNSEVLAEAIDAVNSMKRGPFRLTGLKIEFEAVFFRERSSSTCTGDTCTSRECPNGCWYDDDYDTRRYDCTGEGCRNGTVTCTPCRGTGRRKQLSTGDMVNHLACGGRGWIQCNVCEGEATLPCDCNDGSLSCEHIHIEPNNMRSFNDYVLKQLVPLGLAEEGRYIHGTVLADKYCPTGALKYSKFYVDHSVDTEWTMTLSLEDASVIQHLPEIIRIFTSIGEKLGNGTSSRGAGFHMALLNSEGAVYPTSNGQMDHFNNFRKSMSLLMPALFFMGSSTEKSRPLRYRQPVVRTSSDGKYNAINYTGGALEFRVFETCYERPEAVFEYIITMARCMKFWTPTFTPSGLRKVITRCKFGTEENESLERFYKKEKHVRLLDEGLKILKPRSMTVTELKAYRKFNVTVASIKRKQAEYAEDIELRYREYRDRVSRLWSVGEAEILPLEVFREVSAKMGKNTLDYEGDVTLSESEA